MRKPALKSSKAALKSSKATTISPGTAGLSSQRLTRIGESLNAEIAKGRIPGAAVLVARYGETVYWEAFGTRDPATGAALERNDIFRIYSMTKPICSVAVLMLAEEGRLLLSDPIGKYIPALAKLQVAVPQGGGTTLEPARSDITVQDLLRHTSGLTYGFRSTHIKALYEQAEQGINDLTNAEVMTLLGQLPLAFHPGTTWEYSRSTDVLGALVEVIANRPLGDFLAERILGPLGMKETAFWVPEAKWHRIAQAGPDPDTGQPLALLEVTRPRKFESGGGGLASTAADYLRFAQMLLNGGALHRVRLLSPTTVAWMTADHLGPSISRGVEFLPGPGYGFGLGVAVRDATGLSPRPGSAGDYYWGGAAGTYFWVDPKEQLIGILMLQAPSVAPYYRPLIKSLVLQAVVE
jgi:CubicO group peptidase (beta-lactamase class C family)